MSTRTEHMNAIRQALDGLTPELNWNENAHWTPRVLSELCKVGRIFGFIVGAKADLVPEHDRDQGEFLFDVSWLTRDYRMPFAAECEWDPRLEAVEKDFSKLLVARADLRLMVVSGQNGWEARVRKVADLVIGCPATRVDDFYLLAVPVADANGSTWHFRWFAISQNLHISELWTLG